jgi:putative flippase GtrA
MEGRLRRLQIASGIAAQPLSLATELGRVVRFGFVGVCATLVYAAASLVAIEVFRFSPVLASMLGYCFSMGISYLGHVYYSFRVEPKHRLFLWRFITIAALTFGIAAVLTVVLTENLRLSHRVTIMIISVVIPATSYLCNRLWVFRPELAT